MLPAKSTSVHDGPDWLHEIKNDRYRLRVERDGDRVRLFDGTATTGPTDIR
jgi:ATP-dependent DNA ligase